MTRRPGPAASPSRHRQLAARQTQHHGGLLEVARPIPHVGDDVHTLADTSAIERIIGMSFQANDREESRWPTTEARIAGRFTGIRESLDMSIHDCYGRARSTVGWGGIACNRELRSEVVHSATSGRLTGLNAVVTGGASGIGKATAARFIDEGANVSVLDHDDVGLQALTSEVQSRGGAGRLLTFGLDVADEPSVASAFEQQRARWGRLDIAVINAAVQLNDEDAAIHDLDLGVWERTLRTNLTGAYLTAKHAVRSMLDGPGSVIFTGSPAATYGMARGLHAYSASKGGVHGLVRVMAIEYARYGIRVNAVIPGTIETPLISDLMGAQWLADYVKTIPLGRLGTVDDVTATMVHLSSPESAYTTGAFYVVDGGVTAI